MKIENTGWGHASFPRAIAHIDGDSFFAACEVAKDPTLRGRVVVTGKERGIVSACTYEGKKRGIKRGMRLFEVKKLCPDAVILPSDYETYSLFSNRMYDIVRRYTPAVEEYGIDECFADITGLRRMHHMSYVAIARKIQEDLTRELGITFSIGLSCTKTLAKIGSKWNKPNGFTAIPIGDTREYLQNTPLIGVWGIGANTTALLEKYGIQTAYQFTQKSEAWVTDTLSKPYLETWHELNGRVMLELQEEGRETYVSIQKTKTFTPPSTDPKFIFSQLSKNVENACIKARRWDLVTRRVHFFLKTQDFRYHSHELRLTHNTNVPQDIMLEIQRVFMSVYRKGVEYRTTGVTLLELRKEESTQLDMFGAVENTEKKRKVFKSVDDLSERYGKHALYIGTSMNAMQSQAHKGERGDAPERTRTLFKGETKRRRLAIPMLGEVT